MIRKIQWYNIATRLKDYLKSYRYPSGNPLFSYFVDRDEMVIRVGSGNTGEWPALWILFGDESELQKPDSTVGASVELWLDLYVKGDATPDYDFSDSIYQQLFKAEEELIAVLRKFSLELQKVGLGAKMQIKAILSDGDMNVSANALNIAQNRIVLEIEWREGR